MNKKNLLVVATAVVAGLSLGIAQADDEKKPEGKGKGKGGDPAKRVEMMLKKLDKDGSGTISKKEFAAGPMAERLKDKEGALDKVFAARDKNEDGELDKKELAAPPKHGKGKGPRPDGKGKGPKPDGKGKGPKPDKKDKDAAE